MAGTGQSEGAPPYTNARKRKKTASAQSRFALMWNHPSAKYSFVTPLCFLKNWAWTDCCLEGKWIIRRGGCSHSCDAFRGSCTWQYTRTCLGCVQWLVISICVLVSLCVRMLRVCCMCACAVCQAIALLLKEMGEAQQVCFCMPLRVQTYTTPRIGGHDTTSLFEMSTLVHLEEMPCDCDTIGLLISYAMILHNIQWIGLWCFDWLRGVEQRGYLTHSAQRCHMTQRRSRRGARKFCGRGNKKQTRYPVKSSLNTQKTVLGWP